MKYQDYSVEDFVMDEDFQQWVLSSGTASNDFWTNWLLNNPDKQEMITEARQIILSVGFKKEFPTKQDYNQVWENIEQARRNLNSKTTPLRKNSSWKWYGVAASITAILMLGMALLYFIASSGKTTTYANEFGQTRSITLPDSSVVVLNANSTLSYSKNWDEQPVREVWLDGEAYFRVRKNKVRSDYQKFIVHVGQLQVEVLGTEFNVSKYKSTTQVVLSSGKVKLQQDNLEEAKSIIMQPGELVELSDTVRHFIKKTVNPKLYSAWTEHKWILEHTSLAQVAEKIEATFGVHVSIRDKELSQTKVVGVVPTRNLDTLLKVLSVTLDVNISSKEDTIVISKN
jgi:ferric-dicitrate binding protein FerR (iron transport regulator)